MPYFLGEALRSNIKNKISKSKYTYKKSNTSLIFSIFNLCFLIFDILPLAHFGLDLSPFSIKLIEVRKKGKSFALKGFGETPTPADLWSQKTKDRNLIASNIKKLVADAQVSTKDVALALSESQVYAQVIDMPPMSEGELVKALEFEAEQYIPVPLEEVQLEYLILKTPSKGQTSERMEVLLVAASKEKIEQLTAIVTQAGLVPVVLETEMVAILRALSHQIGRDSVVIDMGQNSTDFAIISDGTIAQVNTFETGGEALTRSLAGFLSLSLEQAERYKRTYGLESSRLEGKIAKAITDPLSLIIDQIKKSIDFFKQRNPKVTLGKAVISGGTALMPDLPAFLARRLDMEIIVANPFSDFIRGDNFPKALWRAASRFSTSVGLAIRET